MSFLLPYLIFLMRLCEHRLWHYLPCIDSLSISVYQLITVSKTTLAKIGIETRIKRDNTLGVTFPRNFPFLYLLFFPSSYASVSSRIVFELVLELDIF